MTTSDPLLLPPPADGPALARHLRRSLQRAVALCAGATLLFLLAITAWVIHDRDEHVANDARRLTVTADVLAAHVERSLATVDGILVSVAERVRSEGLAGVRGQRGHDFLEAQARQLGGVASLFVHDSNGDTLATSDSRHPPMFNAAGRDYFQALLAGAAEPYIDQALAGRGPQQLFFPVARRLHDAQGRLLGVVQVAVAVDFLAGLLRIPELQRYEQLAVFRRQDGYPVAFAPAVPEWLGQPLLETGLLGRLTGPGSEWAGQTEFAGQPAIRVVRILADYGLGLTLLQTREAQLTGFWHAYGAQLVLASLLVLAFLGLFALWYRTVRSQIRLVESTQRQLLARHSALTRQVNHFENLVNTASDAIIARDLEGRVTSWNRGAERLFGYPAAEMLGQRILCLLPDERVEEDRHLLARVRQGGQVPTFETVRRSRDGQGIEVTVMASPICDPQGAIIGVTTLIHDITERKRNLQQLEFLVAERTNSLHEKIAEQRATLSALELARIGCLWVSTEGVVLEVNARAARMFGLPPEAMRQMHFEQLHPSLNGVAFSAIAGSLAQCGYMRLEVPQQRHDGTLVPTEVVLTYQQPTAAIPARVICFEIDIAVRKATEAELHQTLGRLQAALQLADEAVAARGRFLANMSHEIRSPIGAVLGVADIGLREARDPAMQGLFRKIQGAGKHLLGILNDILDLSKIEAGKLAITPAPMRLADTLDNMTGFAESMLEGKPVRFVAGLDADLPDWVIGDSLRVQQILTNLVGNAIKFTERGSVSLSISQHGDRLRFAVSDTGIGISEEALGRLFQRFEQADGSTARLFGGSGLGLSISSRLAEMLGGDIDVVSQPGVGSTFTLTLPCVVCPAEQVPAPIAASDPAQAPFAGLHILACDDVDLNRFILDDLLRSLGAECTVVGDGPAAVDVALAEGATVDVVLMDLQMPGMDGFEATRRIHAARPDLPVIAVTANVLREQREQCLAHGMGHLGKPIDVNALIAVVLQHVGVRARPDLPARPALVAVDRAGPVDTAGQGSRPATGIVDWVALEARYGTKTERFQALLTNARATVAGKIDALARAISDADQPVLASLAHQVKGFAGGLFAEPVHLQALALEAAAQARRSDTVAEAQRFLQLLRAWHAELAAAGRSARDETA